MKANVSVAEKTSGVARVESLMDVPRHARDAEFVAYVAARA